MLFGRKYMGIVRTTFIIDEQGKIAKIFSKVRVDGHLDDVLAAL
ncbi:peroxiredoxin, partial [bacterium]|nr:peroxiredoxin [bacterium]